MAAVARRAHRGGGLAQRRRGGVAGRGCRDNGHRRRRPLLRRPRHHAVPGRAAERRGQPPSRGMGGRAAAAKWAPPLMVGREHAGENAPRPVCAELRAGSTGRGTISSADRGRRTSMRWRSAAGTSRPEGYRQRAPDWRPVRPGPPGGSHAGWSLRSGAAGVPPPPRPGATDQHASSSAGANSCGALMHTRVIGGTSWTDAPGIARASRSWRPSRHDAVPGGDDHRGRDVDLADPPVRAEFADGLDGRDGGGQRGPAQLGAGPAGGGRVVNVAQQASSRGASALISCSSGFQPRGGRAVGSARAASLSAGDSRTLRGGASTAPGRTAARRAAWSSSWATMPPME